MFNPPFFNSVEEKAPRHDTTCLATDSELAYEGGGELELIKQMARDSLKLKERVWWYTSMIGRKVSLKRAIAYLREQNVRVLQLRSGKRTNGSVADKTYPTE